MWAPPGLVLAYAAMHKRFVTAGRAMIPLWQDADGQLKSQWLVAEGQREAGYKTESEMLIDARAGGSY